MGLILRNKDFYMSMGYYTFFQLRYTVAKLYDSNFAELYRQWISQNIEIQPIIDLMYQTNIFNEKDDEALDFLFLPDIEGKVTYKGCKRLYEIVKDYDDNHLYGYINSNHSFSYFKKMLQDCVKHRRNLYWN